MTDTDPRPAFTAAVHAALPVAQHVPADDLHRPTPCAEFDVATLRGHLLAVLRRVAHVGRGGAPFELPHVTTDVPDVDAALTDAADDALAVWSDPDLLDRTLTHPAGPMPGRALLATYTGEVLTHAWDLGVALGRRVEVADEVVAAGAAPSRRILPPGVRPAEFPFGDEVPAPADATPLEQLVAWLGRDPGWTP
ncbi:TIGR03086 family metal-binding protein [Klenkia sp. LSe6-5]|uniref:TIGR03086 family metal-binding protein n=1 Tax=Klenkia sesuvii TaxID=3103137 RepID=A0ABU8DST4_9ACTN